MGVLFWTDIIPDFGTSSSLSVRVIVQCSRLCLVADGACASRSRTGGRALSLASSASSRHGLRATLRAAACGRFLSAPCSRWHTCLPTCSRHCWQSMHQPTTSPWSVPWRRPLLPCSGSSFQYVVTLVVALMIAILVLTQLSLQSLNSWGGGAPLTSTTRLPYAIQPTLLTSSRCLFRQSLRLSCSSRFGVRHHGAAFARARYARILCRA